MATSSGSVEIVVDKKGNVEIKATGFRGPACEKATKEIEEALGDVTSKKRTPESYLTDKDATKQQVRG